MSYTTYSFESVVVTLSHPSIGQYVASGQGIGSISTTMTTDRTTHDVSADGSIMISKVKGRNGSHSIAIQQTSDLNKWLVKLYNYLETAPASEWAGISIVIRSTAMREMITSTGVSFQKLPDRPYQAQGQQVTWQMLSSDIQYDII
jgi:hypothetical protein